MPCFKTEKNSYDKYYDKYLLSEFLKSIQFFHLLQTTIDVHCLLYLLLGIVLKAITEMFEGRN